MKIAVVTVGVCLEFAGVFLIASPELTPWLARAHAGTLAKFRRARGRLRRIFRRHRHVEGSAHLSVTTLIHTRALGDPTVRSHGATVDERLTYLAEELERISDRVQAAEVRLDEHSDEWRREIEQARRDLETLTTEKVSALENLHLGHRLTGIVLLLLGIPLLAIANFL